MKLINTYLLSAEVVKFERLMCEVEFWEVFKKCARWFFEWRLCSTC
jgi:hypothetical protein